MAARLGQQGALFLSSSELSDLVVVVSAPDNDLVVLLADAAQSRNLA